MASNSSRISPRAQVLRLAILNLLNAGPVHGYALRKQLNLSLGMMRTLSYGSLYPALRRLEEEGYISAEADLADAHNRRRITYTLTDAGRTYLDKELSSTSAGDWDDETFNLRFQMFSDTSPDTRLSILEGRYLRVLERYTSLTQLSNATSKHADFYVQELTGYALKQIGNEVEWLRSMIDHERGYVTRSAAAPIQ